jgi:hypothetical protein
MTLMALADLQLEVVNALVRVSRRLEGEEKRKRKGG